MHSVFKGISAKHNGVCVSHLQFSDDTIFFGDWDNKDINKLMNILVIFDWFWVYNQTFKK